MIKDTVNAALCLATGQDVEGRDVDAALDRLAQIPFVDRAEAWRWQAATAGRLEMRRPPRRHGLIAKVAKHRQIAIAWLAQDRWK